MRARAALLCGLLLAAAVTAAQAADRMRFWNLTGATIASLQLAPAGSTRWGPNQCANDPDGTVGPDERLALTGIEAGTYDVRLTDSEGRTCLVRSVGLRAGQSYAFSLSEADLTDCTKPAR